MIQYGKVRQGITRGGNLEVEGSALPSRPLLLKLDLPLHAVFEGLNLLGGGLSKTDSPILHLAKSGLRRPRRRVHVDVHVAHSVLHIDTNLLSDPLYLVRDGLRAGSKRTALLTREDLRLSTHSERRAGDLGLLVTLTRDESLLLDNETSAGSVHTNLLTPGLALETTDLRPHSTNEGGTVSETGVLEDLLALADIVGDTIRPLDGSAELVGEGTLQGVADTADDHGLHDGREQSVVALLDLDVDVLGDADGGGLDDMEVLELVAGVGTLDGRGNEADLQVEINALLGQLKAQETGKFAGGERSSGLVLIPERDVVELELESLDADVSEGADGGARGGDGRVGGGDVDVGDVADVDVRGKEVEGGNVEVLEDELDLVVLVLGTRNGEVAHLADQLGEVDLEEVLPEPSGLLDGSFDGAFGLINSLTGLLSGLPSSLLGSTLKTVLEVASEVLLSTLDPREILVVADALLDLGPLVLERLDVTLPLVVLLHERAPADAEVLALLGGGVATNEVPVGQGAAEVVEAVVEPLLELRVAHDGGSGGPEPADEGVERCSGQALEEGAEEVDSLGDVLLGSGVVDEVGDGGAGVGGSIEGGVEALLEDVEDGVERLPVFLIVLSTLCDL